MVLGKLIKNLFLGSALLLGTYYIDKNDIFEHLALKSKAEYFVSYSDKEISSKAGLLQEIIKYNNLPQQSRNKLYEIINNDFLINPRANTLNMMALTKSFVSIYGKKGIFVLYDVLPQNDQDALIKYCLKKKVDGMKDSIYNSFKALMEEDKDGR
jgi:hypothetical protein